MQRWERRPSDPVQQSPFRGHVHVVFGEAERDIHIHALAGATPRRAERGEFAIATARLEG